MTTSRGRQLKKVKKKDIFFLGLSFFCSLAFRAIHQHKTQFFSLYEEAAVEPGNMST